MSSETFHNPCFDKWRTGKYSQWKGNILAIPMTRGESRLVLGKKEKPNAKETEALQKWEEKALKAAGEIYLSISDEPKVHVQEYSDDPGKMWSKIKSVHLQKKPGMRFNAWKEFFCIHMEENESLCSFINRINAAMPEPQGLHRH